MNMFSLTLFTFKEKFMQICTQIFDFGIAEHEKREEEVKSFWECVEEAKQDNKRLGMVHIDEFTDAKKRVRHFIYRYGIQVHI